MKFSLQSTHLIDRSGCSLSELDPNSRLSSVCDMIDLPGSTTALGGPLRSGSALVLKRGAAGFLASIGVSAGCPRTGEAGV